MKLFTKKLIGAFFIALFLISGSDAFSQCSLSVQGARTGCLGFSLDLQDNTPGVGANATNWTVTLPNSRQQITFSNTRLISYPVPECGPLHVIVRMTNNLNCDIVDSNFIVNCRPTLRGRFTTDVTCAGACVKWIDSSTANTCPPLTYRTDWGQGPGFPYHDSCFYYTSNGTFSPSMVITNACGCHYDTTFNNAITVTVPPTANFTGTGLTSCVAPLTSTMTATASGSNSRYIWSVSPAGTSTYTVYQATGSRVFTHSYGTGGWDIQLLVVDTLSGCSSAPFVQSNYVTAGSFNPSCFTANVTTGCAPSQITFCPCTPQTASGPISYNWYFPGPGVTPQSVVYATGQCVTVNYNQSGVFDARLVIQYSGGCTDTLWRRGYIRLGNPVPIFARPVDTFSCQLPATFRVRYAGTACSACTFNWQPYNGLTPPTNSAPFSHDSTDFSFSSYGTYSYSLTVTDPLGCSQSLIGTNAFTVGQLHLTTAVVAKHTSRCASDTVLLINTTPGWPFQYEWDSIPGTTYRYAHGDTTEIVYGSSGCHPYRIIARTASGCVDTLRDSICTLNKPSVSLTYSPHIYCYQYDSTGFTVTVNGLDTPNSYVRVWTEGICAGCPHVDITKRYYDSIYAYIYPDYGDFGVCYQANNRGCLGDTVCLTLPSDSIHIFPPAPCFRVKTLCTHRDSLLYINCSRGADSIIWTVGCTGQTFTNIDSVYVPIPQCGVNCRVSLTAFNDTFNCHITKVDSISKTFCYGADFVITRTGCFQNYRERPHLVYLDSTSNHPSLIVWDFPLATAVGRPVFNASSYMGDSVLVGINDTAIYSAYAQLTYANGCVDTIRKPGYIDVSGPIVGFRTSGTAGCIPFNVQFTDTSTFHFASRRSFLWNFGDGTVDSTNSAPNHPFTTVGQFLVTLVETDTNGCSKTSSMQIQSNFIQAGFTTSSPITCTTNPSPLNPITVTDTSRGFGISRQWVFAAVSGPAAAAATPPVTVNNNPVSATNPGNTGQFDAQFGLEGVYQIMLICTDQYNICHDTTTRTVTVLNPHADYTFRNLGDTLKTCPSVIIDTLFDQSTNDICDYFWDYGNGNPVYNGYYGGVIYPYPNFPNCYPLKHWVTSCHGCVDTITKYTICINGPSIFVRTDVSRGCLPLTVHFYITSWDCDSLHFSSNTGPAGSTPAFADISTSPRGSSINPRIDTLVVLFTSPGVFGPSIRAFDLSTARCEVAYPNLDTIVVDTPVVNFTDTIRFCGSDSVCFTKNTFYATGGRYMRDSLYFWDFGDATTSPDSNPCHQYAAPGPYTVKLRVLTNYGCSDSITRNIYIPRPPVAMFGVDDTTGCTPFLVHFSDSSTIDDSTTVDLNLSHWDFNNGTPFVTYRDTVSYTYTDSSHVYTTKLIVVDNHGCRDSATRMITVFGPPRDSISNKHDTICLGSSDTIHVVFATSTLVWLDNYNIDTLGRPFDPIVSPLVDTFYVMRVGVLPRCMIFDTAHVYVSKVTVNPSTITSLCLGSPTLFSGNATTQYSSINPISATGYVWHFGDGTPTVSGQNRPHVYSTYGVYYDTLTVTNLLGCTANGYDTIRISDRPHAYFTLSDTSACRRSSLILTDSSWAGTSAALDSFFWQSPLGTVLDSGGVANAATPFIYTDTVAGVYTIWLVQTDGSHCKDTTSRNVYIRGLPIAEFQFDSNCINQRNDYLSLSTPGSTPGVGVSPINHYNWVINRNPGGPIDSSLGIDSTVAYHVFVDSGYYQVSLAVHDIYGCKDSITHRVHILARPVDDVTPLDTTICAGYSAAFNVSGPQVDHVQWVPATWVNNPDSPNVIITPRQTISYLVYSYYRQCAPKIDTVNIWVIDSVPVAAAASPTNIILGLTSNITSTIKGTVDSIVWGPDSTLNCRNCFNPVATPSQTTTYTASIYYHRFDTARNGTITDIICTNNASVTITVYPTCDGKLIYVPNTFTPNNDDHNDLFRLRGQGIISVHYFRVYDRWGKLVYDATNVANVEDAGWNGGYLNNLDNLENTGVYVYLFEVECVTHQIVTGKGNVTLIR